MLPGGDVLRMAADRDLITVLCYGFLLLVQMAIVKKR